jgi:hypothetical protein
MKTRSFNVTLLTVFLVVTLSFPVSASVYNTCYGQASPVSAEKPEVTLQQGREGNSTVYTNDTSATVIVATPATDLENVLRIANQVADNWKVNLNVYNDSDITRLSNATISFQGNSTSDQIKISGGVITQSEGPQYDLFGYANITISISNLLANTRGTSYLYVYLKVLVPNTSTYNLLLIFFQIT